MSDIAAEVQKWKPLIEALGYRCLTGIDEDATVLTVMRGEQVVGCASLHGDGELSFYVSDALSTAREEGRLEGLEIAQSFLVRLAERRIDRNFSEVIVPLLLVAARNIGTIKIRAGDISPKELAEAREAVKRLDAQKGEDPEEWARKLGKMFASYKD